MQDCCLNPTAGAYACLDVLLTASSAVPSSSPPASPVNAALDITPPRCSLKRCSSDESKCTSRSALASRSSVVVLPDTCLAARPRSDICLQLTFEEDDQEAKGAQLPLTRKDSACTLLADYTTLPPCNDTLSHGESSSAIPKTPCPPTLDEPASESISPLCANAHPLSPLDFKPQPSLDKQLDGSGRKFLRTRSEGYLRLRKRSICSAFALLSDSKPTMFKPLANSKMNSSATPCLARTGTQKTEETIVKPFKPDFERKDSLSRIFDEELALDKLDASSPKSFNRPLKRLKVVCATDELISHTYTSKEHSTFESIQTCSTLHVQQVVNPQPYLLPSVAGKSDSIRRIDVGILAALMNGQVSGITNWAIIDCRFPFEYKGGHIDGAINVNSFEQLELMFFPNNCSEKSTLAVQSENHTCPIVFHCEFSSHRAPAMAMHLRAQDRIANMARYPLVTYPEIYVLDGGYKAFYKYAQDKCVPRNYVRMDHPEYKDQCKRELAQRKLSLERSKSATESFKPAGLPRSKSFLSSTISIGSSSPNISPSVPRSTICDEDKKDLQEDNGTPCVTKIDQPSNRHRMRHTVMNTAAIMLSSSPRQDIACS